MYYLIQRYKFESNSQHKAWCYTIKRSCIIWYKDTNLKAIHNRMMHIIIEFVLYYLIQRYKFESNSQHIFIFIILCVCCIIWYKDTNLKAIHNYRFIAKFIFIVVLSDTKIQIWKQFTTSVEIDILVGMLYYLIQRYKFESNSQLCHGSFLRIQVVLSDTKIQIWKQFTTWGSKSMGSHKLYYLIQRYKFESNSQHVCSS